MKSIALALATISFASTPAMAGVYINAESNGSYTGNNFTGRTISASFDGWSVDNFEDEVNKHDDLFRLRRINLDNLPK